MIVGIVIGALVAGVVIIVGVVVLMKVVASKHEQSMKNSLKHRELNQMSDIRTQYVAM